MRFKIVATCKPPLEDSEWSSIEEAVIVYERTMVTATQEGIQMEFDDAGIETKCICKTQMLRHSFTTTLTIVILNPKSENPHDYLAAVERGLLNAEQSYSMFCRDIGAETPLVYHVTGHADKLIAGHLRGHVCDYIHLNIIPTGNSVVEIVKCVVCGKLGQRPIQRV